MKLQKILKIEDTTIKAIQFFLRWLYFVPLLVLFLLKYDCFTSLESWSLFVVPLRCRFCLFSYRRMMIIFNSLLPFGAKATMKKFIGSIYAMLF